MSSVSEKNLFTIYMCSRAVLHFGVHFAFNAAVDDEIAGEAELTFDFHIAGKDVLVSGHGRRAALDVAAAFVRSLAEVVKFALFVLIDDLFEHGTGNLKLTRSG